MALTMTRARDECRELAVEIAAAEIGELIELAGDDRLDDVAAPPPHLALRERLLHEQTEPLVLRLVHAQHVGADHRVERRLVPLVGVRRVALQHVDALAERVHREETIACASVALVTPKCCDTPPCCTGHSRNNRW